MDAFLLIAGAALAFGSSLVVNRRQQQAAARAELFLRFLPTLRSKMIRWRAVADQGSASPRFYLQRGEWLSAGDIDDAYRQAVLAGPADVRRMRVVRDAWRPAAGWVDPECGIPPLEQIYGEQKFVELAQSAIDALDGYIGWLEGRAVGWRGRRAMARAARKG